ncbi:MAG: type II toxin-antitoxin system VapC family toxin [Candidatus Riflebacteria bacterium]|nr:type II toxin-antitoxin system VapC family toxin [Candidatus Riflebacteria bacterium]
MNGINYILDTNAIIYLLSGNSVMKQYLSSSFALSVISKLELLSFTEIDEKEENVIKSFISECTILNINSNIEDITIKLRKKYKIKLPDAIIAATSIDYNVPLITADRGFSKIQELKLELITPL